MSDPKIDSESSASGSSNPNQPTAPPQDRSFSDTTSFQLKPLQVAGGDGHREAQSEASPSDSPPEQLGRFQIQRCLGKGGFGDVYLAHDPQLDRLVALKVPRRARFRSAEQVGEFIAEARTAAKLKHYSLVSVYDVQQESGLPFIVQEYIDGTNLADWARQNQPDYATIVRILIEISEALAYLHLQGLTHCDLKLANVLMNSAGKPHVADFGLTVHESWLDQRRGMVFGTPAMMSPEQVRGEGHRLDGRTDIWALGIMLYELLVSRQPFTAKTRDQLFDDIKHHDPKPLRQIDRKVPKELERICLKCLSKRRTDRYTTAEDLRDDLAAWLNSEALTQASMRSEGSTLADSSAGTGSRRARLSSIGRSTPAAGSATDSGADSANESGEGSQRPVKIIPKGLRSFDETDTDFFLELLPGVRDREGLPESIRFLEAADRGDRCWSNIHSGPGLRAIGLRQEFADESRSAAATLAQYHRYLSGSHQQ
jgi:eukaryotic-like serine/threonine-protein kinase